MARPPSVSPHCKLYLSTRTLEGVFGEGKWQLLKAIQEDGSIQRAAERLGRGYRKAWADITLAEKGLGRKLVVKSRGGAEGGGTHLTVYGAALVTAWARYRDAIDRQSTRLYHTHLEELISTAGGTP